MEEILKAPYLKHLYGLLLEMGMSEGQASLFSFTDIRVLSDALFGALDRAFAAARSTSLLGGAPPASPRAVVQEHEREDLYLLRCCFVVLQLLEFDLTLVMDKTKVLLRIFRQLFYLDPPGGAGRLGVCRDQDPCAGTPHFRCSFLEVIADGMLLYKHLGKHLKVTDFLSEEPEKLFASHSNHADVGFIMELLCTHFILFFGDKKGLDKLYNSLFWACGSEIYTPSVSLSAILTLLGNAIYLSLPRIIQTHTLLLASACIGTSLSSAHQDSNDLPLNCYMVAFGHSVDLYRQMILNDGKLGSNCPETEIASGKCFGLSFESFVRSTTRSRIEHRVSELEEWYGNDSHIMISENNMDKESIVMAYVKENEHVVEKPFREEIYLFLKCIMSISNLRTAWHEAFDAAMGNDWQVLFCVAAILKLMSSSLLHIVWTFKQTGMSDSRKRKYGASLTAYNCILGIIFSFIHGGVDSITDISDFLNEPCPTEYKERTETKMMLVHFVDLFLYSVDRGIACLWKGSIFMVMVLLNFVLSNQGNVEALNLFNCVKIPSASLSKTSFLWPLHKSNQCHQTSSLTIASRFQKIQALHLKEDPPCLTYEINSIECETSWNAQEGTERSENPLCMVPVQDGETGVCSMVQRDRYNELYLRCIGCMEKDVDELADFVDYTPGKDYIDWMKNRKKFREWKAGKLLAARHHRRIKNWAVLRLATQKHK